MATTNLIPLHTLKGYTPAKSVGKVIKYVENPQKTENGNLVMGFACKSCFRANYKRHPDWYHLIWGQSAFAPGKTREVPVVNTFGYVRVSSQDQNEDRQMIAMQEFGVPVSNIFLDKQSGKDFNRPQYIRMTETVQEGDLLVVKSIDRLGRSYDEIGEQWRILTKEKKIDICVIEMTLLDTRQYKDLMGTFIADLVLQVLSFCSESERDAIRRRQAEGIAAAKARGVRFGRPKKTAPDDFAVIVQSWRNGTLKLQDAIDRSGVCKSTFFQLLKEQRKNQHENVPV